MYRNVLIVGLTAGLVGAAAAAVVAGGGDGAASGPELRSASAQLQLTGSRLVTADRRPAGECRPAAPAVGDCRLTLPVEGGTLEAEGLVRRAGRSTIGVTGGSGPFAGARGRASVSADGRGGMQVAFDVVVADGS